MIMIIVWEFKFCSSYFQKILFLHWLPTAVILSSISSCWWRFTKGVQAHHQITVHKAVLVESGADDI